MSDEWYYEVGGKGYGPIPGRELKQLADSGLITPKTLIRQGARGNWMPAERVRGLFAEGVPAVGPPPAAEPPPIINTGINTGGGAVRRPGSPGPAAPSFPAVEPVQEAAPFNIAPSGQAAANPYTSFGVAPVSSSRNTRTPRYDALVTVARLYDALAWVVLVLGGIGVLGYAAMGIFAAAQLGGMMILYSLVGAAFGALITFLWFITLRAAAQGIYLAMDIEKNTRATNDLLASLRDHFTGGGG
jgi:hypothetical protein